MDDKEDGAGNAVFCYLEWVWAMQLSPREREVLVLVANGNEYKTVGRLLKPRISEKTVKNYMRFIYAKLGAHNCRHAVLLALKAGIISLEELRPVE